MFHIFTGKFLICGTNCCGRQMSDAYSLLYVSLIKASKKTNNFVSAHIFLGKKVKLDINVVISQDSHCLWKHSVTSPYECTTEKTQCIDKANTVSWLCWPYQWTGLSHIVCVAQTKKSSPLSWRILIRVSHHHLEHTQCVILMIQGVVWHFSENV